MEQLFKMPIKGILNLRAKDRQINHQPTLSRAFQHFLIVSTCSSIIFPDFYLILFPSIGFQSFHASAISFPFRFHNEIYYFFNLFIQFFSHLSIHSNFQSIFHLDSRKLSRELENPFFA